MIVAICAPPGYGKTLFMAWSALQWYAKGEKLYSNFNLYHPITKEPLSSKIISQGDLNRARGGRVFIDEIAKWLDSRFSQSSQNQFVNSVLQLHRKRALSLEWSAQDFYMADVRLRLNTDYVIVPEVYYIIDGRELKFKQDYFNPINTKLLLPYAYFRANMFDGQRYQSERILTEADIVNAFSFKVQPVSECYDTREEVKELLMTERDKGMEFEEQCAKYLKERYPDDTVIKMWESGNEIPDTFDIEWKHNGELRIIDSKTLSEGKILRWKDKGKDVRVKSREIVKSRLARTFFMIELEGELWLIDMERTYEFKTSRTHIKNLQRYFEKV